MADAKVGLGVALFAVLAACAGAPPPDPFERDFGDDTKGWKEIQTQLPASPRSEDLISFSVSGATPYRFSIDRKSLAIGSDGVYRYTLVAVSAEGARNVSYEGIRCATREKKIYAIGRNDGTWVRARNAAWTPIEEVDINRSHAALMKDAFCPVYNASKSVAEILARMSKRPPPSVL